MLSKTHALTENPFVVLCVCVCVCVRVCVCACTRIGKKRIESGMGGIGGNGKELAAAKVGVRCGGDGVDSCVQVGVKTLGGLVCV